MNWGWDNSARPVFRVLAGILGVWAIVVGSVMAFFEVTSWDSTIPFFFVGLIFVMVSIKGRIGAIPVLKRKFAKPTRATRYVFGVLGVLLGISLSVFAMAKYGIRKSLIALGILLLLNAFVLVCIWIRNKCAMRKR